MRIKLIVLLLVLASLACTANVTVLKTTPTALVAPLPDATVEPAQPVSPPLFENQPVVVPQGISPIHMLDPQNGWMITNEAVLRTADGGATWHSVTPPGASTLGYGTGVSFLNTSHGWVLTGDANDPLNSGTLYRTSDGGLHWDVVPVPFGAGDLHFLDTDNGWMMLPAGIGTGNMAVKFFQTTDAGRSWDQVFSNVPTDVEANDSLPYGGIKSGFTPLSMQEAWVSGQTYASNDFYLYHTTDGGRTWSAVEYPLPLTGEAMILTQPPVFFDRQTGLLPVTVSRAEPATLFLKTQDGGSTWTAGASVPGAGQYAIASPEDVFVWSGRELLVSRDAGQSWSTVSPNVSLGDTLSQLQFVDDRTGWALTSDVNGWTSLYRTTDGGQTWTVQVD